MNLFSNKKKLTNSWTYFTEFIIGNTLHAWIIRWCNHINVYSAMFACLNLIWFKIKIAQYLHNIQIFANEDSLFWLWAMNIPWIDWPDVKRSGSENKQQSFGFGAHARVDVAMSETGENGEKLSKRYKITVFKRCILI